MITHNSQKCKLVLVCTFFIFITACHHNDKQASVEINKIKSKIHIGDLIVREGVGYESTLIKQMSNSSYSHIGMITQIEPTILITHATTDDDIHKPNQVIVSSFEEFTSHKRAKGWAIYRQSLLTQQEIQHSVNYTKTQIGRKFDLAVKQENGFYCTILIANSYPPKLAEQLQWSKVDILIFKGEMLYPNALIQEKDGVQLIIKSLK